MIRELDTVVLTHADTDKGPICRIKRSVLEDVVERLAKARGDHAGAVAVGAAHGHPATPRVKKKSKSKAKHVATATKRAGKKERGHTRVHARGN